MTPFIEIRDGVHPTIVSTFSGDEYIPNDIVIGINDENDDDDVDDDSKTKSTSPPSTVLVTGWYQEVIILHCAFR